MCFGRRGAGHAIRAPSAPWPATGGAIGRRGSYISRVRSPLPILLFLPLAACVVEEVPEEAGPCVDEDRDMDYVAGLAVESELGFYSAELIDAVPAPPDTGENTWILRVTDGSRAALSADGIVARPWMPDHGHGTNPATWPLVDSGDGDTLRLEGVDLIMPGLWRIALEIPASAGEQDEVRFFFCAEG